MLKIGGLSVLVIAATVATAYTATSAVAHRDPCHTARTCPSDDHSYIWSGMSCTSHATERLPEDQIPIDWRGVRYWCHVVTDLGMGGGTPKVSKPSCKADRASVRTLRDPAASKVRLDAVSSTVGRLERLRFPGSVSPHRDIGAERTVYRLHVRLLQARLVDRSEWELTIGDQSSGATLVAGLPAPRCTAGADADVRGRMAAARAALVQACGLGNVGSAVRLRGTARLDAVGFVPSRGTAGADAVHLELRPVIAFAAASCAAQR